MANWQRPTFPIDHPENVSVPVVTGNALVGSTLSATTGEWRESPTLHYQWLADLAEIEGANDASFLVTHDQSGSALSVVVGATNNGGTEYAFSSETGTVPASSVPENLSLPVISGDTFEGGTLTTTNGTWNGSPSGYAYQWYADDVEIVGATSNSYVLTASEVDAMITVVVTATNAFGSMPAESAAVGPIGDNLLTDPGDFTTAAWTASGGLIRTADTLDDSAGFATGQLSQTFTVEPYKLHKLVARIEKTAGGFFSLFRFDTDDDWMFNANDGLTERVDAAASFIATPDAMVDDGTHYIFTGYFIPKTSTPTLNIFPAAGSSFGSGYGISATGAITFSSIRVTQEDESAYNYSFADWSSFNACVGLPNLIEDNVTALIFGYVRVSKDFATTNGVSYTITARMLKNTGAKGIFRINGATDFGFDVDTGNVSGTGMSSTDDGTHWIFELTRTATGSTTNVEIYPAISNVWPLSYGASYAGYIQVDDFSFV